MSVWKLTVSLSKDHRFYSETFLKASPKMPDRSKKESDLN